MKKKYQIFVSSTYSDLVNERQSAVETILRASHIPAGMELFTAGNETQFEIIKRWINDSDVYILILGGRYGSVEPSTGLSYTELEYRYALEQNKPILALVSSEIYLKNKDKAVIETLNIEKYNEFRKLVLSKICRYFNEVNDIKLGILESIIDIQNRYSIEGWVKTSELFEKNPPYIGEWAGTIDWTEDWAGELMNPNNKKLNFRLINPRAEGLVYIYSTSTGVYKCFATWTLLNSEIVFSKSAVLGSDFNFSSNNKLISFNFQAHSRKIMKEDDEMGPSPLYKVIIIEESDKKIIAKMTIPQFNNREIGTLRLIRV